GRTWRHTWRADFPLGTAWVLLRAGDPRVRGSVAHYRERRTHHGRRRWHVDQARSRNPDVPVSKPRRVLLDHPGARRRIPRDHTTDRTLTFRRLACRGTRERGCGKGAWRRCKQGQADCDGYFGRHHRGRWMLLRAIFSLCGFRNCLWHVDFGSGAADPDHWRCRNRVWTAGRCLDRQIARRGCKARGRRCARPRPHYLRCGARAGYLVCTAWTDRRARAYTHAVDAP